MGRTTTIRYGGRGFWALDDALAVWRAFLVEELDRHEDRAEPWVANLSAQWHRAAAISEFGAEIGSGTPEQISRLRDRATQARSNARIRGSLSEDDLRGWIILDDLPVAGAFSRAGTVVEIERVLEVADAFLALLDGTLPPDPPGGAWFLGSGRGFAVIPDRSNSLGEFPPRKS